MSLTAKKIGKPRSSAKFFGAMLLGGTMLAGVPHIALAQDQGQLPPANGRQSAAPVSVVRADTIRTIAVAGAQRLESQTILSYVQLRVGEEYTAAKADQALKDLAATELFSDFSITNNNGDVVIEVVENPIINRIIIEGNKRIKDDKVIPEIKLAPRQIFTRSKVRADVARIIELYKRQGRFAATVEPKMVELEQNRVDIVFEVTEGPKSKVRQINIIGNDVFSDGDLRSEMVTKQTRWHRLFSSSTGYDPDRLAFDQQKLRQFYLTEGYADFRVVSAVAELTPDKRDFIITYVVEEGERYKFGEVKVDSQLRDFDSEALSRGLGMRTGDWYNAKAVEDTVEQLTDAAGTFGYAFAEVRPNFGRERENLTMNITFDILEAPRVYVERVDVNGNTLTQDKVVRREFRIAEGDAFNLLSVKRSTSRINSLGFFQENLQIEQKPGSQPDRIVLEANVQEQPTGELQLSAGFSSLESFILQGSIRERNFRGRGQTVGLSLNWSRYSRSGSISFTEPYVFDKNISFGLDLYRRDYNNGYFRNQNASYEQSTTGFQTRLGVPLTEYLSLIGRYTLNLDNVFVDEGQYFVDLDGDGVATCEPYFVGRYLCDTLGKRTTSSLGLSLVYNTLDNRIRPTRGETAVLNVDFAGLGGSVKYIKARANASKFWNMGSGFIFSVTGEAGYIKGLSDRGAGQSDVRLTDRFFLGEPQIRGFDIRGIGPRIIRRFYNTDGTLLPRDPDGRFEDSLGGNAMYMGRAEIEIPLGTGARELGLRPSIFLDAGALFNIDSPNLSDFPDGLFIPQYDANGNPQYVQIDSYTTTGAVTSVVNNPIGPFGPNQPLGSTQPAFVEQFVGDSAKPRLAIGAGVNWNSPFGPFRIDFAHVLLKDEGDDTKAFSFNVGTQF